MTHRSSVFGRRTDALQYATGLLNALVFAAVIWGTGWLLLKWALR